MPRPTPEALALSHRKACTLCSTPRDVLIRCQIDSTGKWHFVCPGSCWKTVSGGVIDGDLAAGHENYRYGGMWKNKHAGVSAKVPKRLKGKMVRGAKKKAKNDEVDEEEGGCGSGSEGSPGSEGSEGSVGSVGSASTTGSKSGLRSREDEASSGVLPDDKPSEGGTTLVDSKSSVDSQHESVRT